MKTLILKCEYMCLTSRHNLLRYTYMRTHTHTFTKRKLLHSIFVLKVKYLPVKNYQWRILTRLVIVITILTNMILKTKQQQQTNTHTHTWTFTSTINQNLIREKQLKTILKQIKIYVEHLHSDKHSVIWVTKTAFDDQHD